MKKINFGWFTLSCRIFIIACLLMPVSSQLFSQDKQTQRNNNSPTAPDIRLESFEHHKTLKENSIFKNLKWRSLGPSFQGGRVTSIAVPPGDHFVIYAGFASGSIWKTVNNATTWEPIFDNESAFSIGDIAISDSHPEIIYVGTGDALMGRQSYAGTGIFKSTDSGKTWQNIGLHDSHHIRKVVIHPDNPDIVYVAAMGHLFTYNEEKGIFKTSDGGKTWKKILYINEKVGASDIVMDPTDPKILYASTWQTESKLWNQVEAGEGSGIYKTTDGGSSWKKLSNGFPQGEHVGRIGLAVSTSNPKVVYALLDNHASRPEKEKPEWKSGLSLYQIRDMAKGQFLLISAENLSRFLRENRVPEKYTAEMILDMVTKNELTPSLFVEYILYIRKARKILGSNIIGGEVYRSDDQGETWRRMNENYLDKFFATIGFYFGNIRVSPDDENKIYLLGIRLLSSDDGGETFEHIGGKGVHVDHHDLWIDHKKPDRLILGNDGGINFSYDRGETWQDIRNMPTGQFYTVSVGSEDPYNIFGGMQDNGVVFGPSTYTLEYGIEEPWERISGGDGFYVFADPTDSNLVYFGNQFGRIFRKNLSENTTQNISPRDNDDRDYIFYNWMTPFVVSHHNPSALYLGGNKLLKSIDRGESWVTISPDLTTNPGRILRGDVIYGTITTISESPLKPGLIYVATDDGLVHVTQDDGANWKEISYDLPNKWVSRVIASQYEEGTVFLSLTGLWEDDFEKYLYMSTDYGETWTSIASNLPSQSINVIREDPKKKSILYVGTDIGVYVSLDRGKKWHSLSSNLPTTPVRDMMVHPRDNDLAIATYGRSIYVLDVSIIQNFDENVQEKHMYLFKIKPALLPRSRSGLGEWAYDGLKEAHIYYYLREPLMETYRVDISVHDKSGKLIKRLNSTQERGLNMAVWDLTTEEGYEEAEGVLEYANFIDPGTYKIKLSVKQNDRKKKSDF